MLVEQVEGVSTLLDRSLLASFLDLRRVYRFAWVVSVDSEPCLLKRKLLVNGMYSKRVKTKEMKDDERVRG